MKKIIKAGATSQTVDVFIQDSTSTTGAGKTGLAYNTAGLKAYYRKGATGSATAITLATQTVGGAYSSGGFVEIDATNMPGLYRLDVPNAAIDTAGSVSLMLSGATGMAPLPLELQVVAADLEDGVRLGLTALPNAAAGANTGLPVVGTQVPNATAGASGGLLISGSNSGTTTLDALTISGAMSINGTGHVAQTGDSYARIGAPAGASLAADVASIKVDTGTTLPGRLTATRAGYLDNLSSGAVALASGVNVTQWLGGTPNALISGRLDVNLQAGATGVISAALLASDAANEIADALLDRADAIETGITLRLASRYTVAAAAGVASGMATTTAVIKGANVLTTRITATVDADGNRSSVTLS